MDMYSIVQRFKGRFVTLNLYSRQTLIGTVDQVSHECVLMKNAVIFDELEGGRWQEEITRSNLENGVSEGSVETAVSFGHIAAISCDDPDLECIETEASTQNVGLHVALETLASNVQSPSEDTEQGDIQSADRIEMLISVSLISTIELEDLKKEISRLRKTLADKLGFRFPKVRIRDSTKLKEGQYEIRFGGVKVADGLLRAGKKLAIFQDDKPVKLNGESTFEPSFGLPAMWLENEKEIEKAKNAGLVVADACCILVTHLSETIQSSRHRLLSYEMTVDSLEDLRETSPRLVSDHFESATARQRLHQLLVDLLRDRVWIGNLERIAEAVAWNLSGTNSAANLLAAVREQIADLIVRDHIDQSGKVRIIGFCSNIEKQLTDKTLFNNNAAHFKFAELIMKAVEKLEEQDIFPVVAVPKEIRVSLATTFRGQLPQSPIVSLTEMLQTGNGEVVRIITSSELDNAESKFDTEKPLSSDSIEDIREIPR